MFLYTQENGSEHFGRVYKYIKGEDQNKSYNKYQSEPGFTHHEVKRGFHPCLGTVPVACTPDFISGTSRWCNISTAQGGGGSFQR